MTVVRQIESLGFWHTFCQIYFSIEVIMAVQQNRKTPSKRGMRRSHDRLKNSTLSIDPVTGELHRRHHVTADGYYRGKKVVETAADE